MLLNIFIVEYIQGTERTWLSVRQELALDIPEGYGYDLFVDVQEEHEPSKMSLSGNTSVIRGPEEVLERIPRRSYMRRG